MRNTLGDLVLSTINLVYQIRNAIKTSNHCIKNTRKTKYLQSFTFFLSFIQRCFSNAHIFYKQNSRVMWFFDSIHTIICPLVVRLMLASRFSFMLRCRDCVCAAIYENVCWLFCACTMFQIVSMQINCVAFASQLDTNK